jgi:hypothetical protein
MASDNSEGNAATRDAIMLLCSYAPTNDDNATLMTDSVFNSIMWIT